MDNTFTFFSNDLRNKYIATCVLLFLVVFRPNVTAQCTMICNNFVSVSLDQSCEAEVLYDMVLEDPNNPLICTPNGPTNYLIEVYDALGNLLPTSPFVTVDELGQVLTVKAIHIPTGNFCNTNLVVEDNLAPQLTCPPDVTIACTQNPDTTLTGLPVVNDCVNFSLSLSDLYQNNGCVDPKGQVLRTWTAVDDYGNAAVCTQLIYVALPQNADVTFPPDYDDQDQPALDCDNAQTDTSFTGQPTIAGLPIPTGGECQMSVSFSDQIVQGCGGSYTIQRSWTIVNWCSGQILSDIQVIAVKDTEPPVIDCPAQLTVGTNYSTMCVADVVLPPAIITDNCASTFNVSVFGPTGVMNNNGGTLTGLPQGTHTLTWQAVDPCGNVGTCTTIVEVVDDLAPTAVCDQLTTVSLNTDGTAVVNAATFDDGSYDNCCMMGFEVRRMADACGVGTNFGPTAVFCCADVGDTLQVAMRAIDCYGNTATCVVQVIVEDKIGPSIACPTDVTILCVDDATDTSLTGLPTVFDNCGADTVGYTDQANLNSCGIGTITRTWAVVDPGGLMASCTQLIAVVDTTPVAVSFPPDITLTTCTDSTSLHPDSLPAPYNEPVFSGNDCELLAVSYDDTYFPVADNACFKIVRTWSVINWCTWDPNDPTDTGYYEGVQVLKVVDTAPPLITCPDELSVGITDTTCTTTITLPDIVSVMDCSPEITTSISSDLGDGPGPFVGVGPGTYTITYTVTDGCGNASTCATTLTVADAKPPTPYCINGLVVELMPIDTSGDGFFDTGMIEIWASDFDAGSYDNCSAQLSYSFSSDTSLTSMVLGCDSIGQIPLMFWVTDEAGNQDFCQTYVIVQDNNGVCVPVPPSIAGTIYDEMGQGVADVVVGINGGMSALDTTGVDGTYFFALVPPASDYTVTPYKNWDIHNGVTTLDALLIRKHLLGIEPLSSPLKMIAADVNNSHSLSISDMIAIRRVVLWEADTFPNNTAWRFVDAAYQFQNPQSPFAENWPEVYNINNLLAPIEDINFKAIKTGDVNNTAMPNPLWASQERVQGTLPLRIVQINEEDTHTATLQVFGPEGQVIQAMQLTLDLGEAALRLRHIEGVALPELEPAHFGYRHLGQGFLTMSYEYGQPIQIGMQPLFVLHFAGTESIDVRLSDALTPPLAWTSTAQALEIVLAQQPTASWDLALVPNPVADELNVRLHVSTATDLQLAVFDMKGRQLWATPSVVATKAGMLQWRVPVARWPAGTYVLRLSANEITKYARFSVVH